MCFLSVGYGLECATSSVLYSFFGSNPLTGCFKSVSVNMAEIMLPNLVSKRILFVKPVWYSSHSQLNHLVAVFALSQRNITLSDLVVPSLATSLKWVMIINPAGHVQWNPIDLHIPNIWIHIIPQTSQCRPSISRSTTEIFHFKFPFTVRHQLRKWTLRHILKAGFSEYKLKWNVKSGKVTVCYHALLLKGVVGMEGTSLICILFRWLALVGSCRYGIFSSQN